MYVLFVYNIDETITRNSQQTSAFSAVFVSF